MGILAKSLSYCRYFVRGELPADFSSWVTERLQRFQFQEIDDEQGEKSSGWVQLNNLLQADFSDGLAIKGEYVAFSLRIDTRRVPPALLRKHYLLAERQVRQQQRFRPLSRTQQQELKRAVARDLLARQLPQPSLYDVVWQPASRRLWLFATSPKVREIFETLFRETFELDLFLLFPYTLAQDLLPQEASLERLELIDPTIFITSLPTRT